MVHCGADMIKSLALVFACSSGFCQVHFEIADEHRFYSVSLFLGCHALAINRECIAGVGVLVYVDVNKNFNRT
jgi:hypothetical protein